MDSLLDRGGCLLIYLYERMKARPNTWVYQVICRKRIKSRETLDLLLPIRRPTQGYERTDIYPAFKKKSGTVEPGQPPHGRDLYAKPQAIEECTDERTNPFMSTPRTDGVGKSEILGAADMQAARAVGLGISLRKDLFIHLHLYEPICTEEERIFHYNRY